MTKYVLILLALLGLGATFSGSISGVASGPLAACHNYKDDDGDGYIDGADGSCSNTSSISESPCSNGVDDDGDSLADYPTDPGCDDASDDSEDNGGVVVGCVTTPDNSVSPVDVNVTPYFAAGRLVVATVACGNNVNAGGYSSPWTTAVQGNSFDALTGSRLYYATLTNDPTLATYCQTPGTPIAVAACVIDGADDAPSGGGLGQTGDPWTPASYQAPGHGFLFRAANRGAGGGVVQTWPFNAPSKVQALASNGSVRALLDWRDINTGESDASPFDWTAASTGSHMYAFVPASTSGQPPLVPHLATSPSVIQFNASATLDPDCQTATAVNDGDDGSTLDWTTAKVSVQDCGTPDDGWFQIVDGSGTNLTANTPPIPAPFQICAVGSHSCNAGNWTGEACVNSADVGNSPQCIPIILTRAGNVPPTIGDMALVTSHDAEAVTLSAVVTDPDDTPTLSWTWVSGATCQAANIASPSAATTQVGNTVPLQDVDGDCVYQICADDPNPGTTCKTVAVHTEDTAAVGGWHSNTVTWSNKITWTFDQAYDGGFYLDGMPWVKENAPGGGVRVTGMSPAYSAGRNGWAENPNFHNKTIAIGQYGCAGSQGCYPQPFDNRLLRSPALAFTPPDQFYGSLGGGGRLYVAGSSILKVVSNPTTSPCGHTSDFMCLTDAAVLTVVASNPSSDALRPPAFAGSAFGGQKPTFVLTGFDAAQDLPNLPLIGGEPTLDSILSGAGNQDAVTHFHHETYAAGDDTTQDFTKYWGDGKPSNYGCDRGMWYTQALMRLSQAGDATKKRALAIYMLQQAIDRYYSGHVGDLTGCIGQGSSKSIVMWAGRLLNRLDQGTWQSQAAAMASGNLIVDAIDYGTYYAGNGRALWGQQPCSTNPPACGGNCTKRWCDVDIERDGGGCENGDAVGCSPTGPQPTITQHLANGTYSTAKYQRMIGPYLGSVASARVYGFESAWNWPATFDYVDRITSPPWSDGSPSVYTDATPYNSNYLRTFFDEYGCSSVSCQNARAACSNGGDDDHDGLIDFGSDGGCSSPTDNSE